MNVFLNLTTRTRLFFGFGLILLLLLAVIATAYRGMIGRRNKGRGICTNWG